MKNDDTNFNRIMAGLGEVVDIVDGSATSARVYAPENLTEESLERELMEYREYLMKRTLEHIANDAKEIAEGMQRFGEALRSMAEWARKGDEST